ncbi:MAG: hypothetical protein GC172_06320 [Phycisphaera sp.]|nr:hypothetical protein [Phycisphaera sp.]
MRLALRTLAVALAIAAPSVAQVAPATAPASASAPASSPTAAAKPHRVAIIGASASAGFGCVLRETRDDGEYALGFRLGDMIRLACPELELVTSDLASGFFFLAPVKNGAASARRAAEFNPDCVLALDFLFWYCYGDDAPEGGAVTDESQRLAKLELGLKELEKFAVPVLVGDIPDMSPAVGRMLSPAQMPAKDTLAKANARFAEWAAARANIVVVPLAAMQRQLMEERALEIRGVRLEGTAETPLLQRDQLHPAPLGLAGLASAIAADLKDALASAKKTPVADDCDPEPKATFERARAGLKPSRRAPQPTPAAPAARTAPAAP